MIPASDELELSVFGRGYGEAICVHLGDGEWMLVDSCIDPARRAPAALAYLESIGVPFSQVRVVVATHWHDDHVQGLGAVVEACANATVVCSAALRRKEVFAFVVAQENAAGGVGSGVDELRRLLTCCADRGKSVIWAKANLPLHPRPPGSAAKVVALAPSEDACERSMISLIEAAENAKLTVPRRYTAPDGPNGASVVLAVAVGGEAMLLGGDLENSPNDESGWKAVVTYARPESKASAVKIPHHGSANAHSEEMWTELVHTERMAIITPWIKGRRFLPTDADVARISTVCRDLFLTAMPEHVMKKRKADKLVARLHGAPITELNGWGHVRARRKPSDSTWRVELKGDAVKA